MITIPVAVLPKTLKRVPVEAVIQELQVEAPVAAIPLAVEAPVAVNQTAAPAAVVQATAVPVVEVNLEEAVLAAVVRVVAHLLKLSILFIMEVFQNIQMTIVKFVLVQSVIFS